MPLLGTTTHESRGQMPIFTADGPRLSEEANRPQRWIPGRVRHSPVGQGRYPWRHVPYDAQRMDFPQVITEEHLVTFYRLLNRGTRAISLENSAPVPRY